MYKPRLQSGPIGFGTTLSAGPAFGWVGEFREADCSAMPCVSVPRENRFTAGASADAAVDVHLYNVTLSMQVRWRTTFGSQGVYNTWSIGPNLGAHW